MSLQHLHLVFAFLSFAGLILLITRARMHPFLALAGTGILLGLLCGITPDKIVASFEKGFGDVAGRVGIVVALGVILGGVLVSSGGADRLAESLVTFGSARALPWNMALAATLICLPLFFEVGLVLLTPICFALAKKSGLHPLRLGIPMLAGIIAAHGLLPPHPAPTIAVAALGADLGRTILWGFVIALPAVSLAGPLFAKASFRFFPDLLRDDAATELAVEAPGVPVGATEPPSLAQIYIVVLLPHVLMLTPTVAQLFLAKGSPTMAWLTFLGTPMIALLATTAYAIWALALGRGWKLQPLQDLITENIGTTAGVILITGAGGGLKQVLIDTKIGDYLVGAAIGAHMPPLVLAWLTAAVLRISIGTSTVATIMAAGLLTPLIAQDATINRQLAVLAIGTGSIFGSHLNDPGFWFVKQYFGLSLTNTFKTWTALTTLFAVFGLGMVLLLNAVI